jgi:hypothetical protein
MPKFLPSGACCAAALAAIAQLSAGARAAGDANDTAVTIYSSAQPGAIQPELYRTLPGGSARAASIPGYAIVREDRTMSLERGRSTLRFGGVPGLIDPTTVSLSSLTDPQTRVIEQSFQFDLASTERLLAKFTGQPITVERAVGGQLVPLTGTLLSSSEGLVLRDKDGAIHALRDYSAITFPALPAGSEVQPTLVWDVLAPKGGMQRVRVSYQTGGLTWWADYNAVFNAAADASRGTLDLNAWVSIANLSGVTYSDAALKLLAGDLNRVAPQAVMALRTAAAAAPEADNTAGFSEQSLFEFHLYSLGRRTTLADNSTKQIELFPEAKQIPARKTFVYAGQGAHPRTYPNPMTERTFGVVSNPRVDVFLEFTNDAQRGLGMPLPAGRVRVSTLDADGALQLIGEDRIDHTAKGEQVRVRLGSAFDVVGERRQIDFSSDTKAHTMEEEIEIHVRNRKTQPIDVRVLESLYRASNWTILTQNRDFEKQDAHTIAFPVSVAADAEAVVRYRVRYTW